MEKCGKVGNSGEKWRKGVKRGEKGLKGENHFRSLFSPFQINTQFFFGSRFFFKNRWGPISLVGQ